MPGKVTLVGSARDAFMRDGRDEPRMGGKLDPRHVPKAIGQGRATHKRGEFRRSVKPANSAGRHVRHCEVKLRFHYEVGAKGSWARDNPKTHSLKAATLAKSAAVGGKPMSPARGQSGMAGNVKTATTPGGKSKVGSGGKSNGPTHNIKHYAQTYLVRDGAGIDGEKPEYFSVDQDGNVVKADGGEFVHRVRNDRFVVEVFIPPNDGDKIKDMPGFTAAFMAKLEDDLDTKLTWVAVVHEKHDIAHPVGGPKNKHVHVLMRGVDDQKNELWISREYMSSTLRDVAQRELTAYPTNEREKGWRLGRMSEQEAAAFQKQMADNRQSRIDKGWTIPTEQERQQMRDRERAKEQERNPATEAGKQNKQREQRKREQSRGMEV